MSEEETKKAVEESENAATQEKAVKDEEARVAALEAENDLLAKYEALQKENEKIAADRDNYRKGLLSLKKAKKNTDEEDQDDEEPNTDIEALIDRKVTEKLLNTEEYRIKKEQELITQKALKENKELKLALKTKSSVASGGAASGGNQDVAKSDKGYFSEAQLADIHERERKTGIKIDLKKLEENMRRVASK